MTYDPKRHHRRSIRLKGYDYTQVGAYYVTIVCQDRACLFGEIVDGEMQLNDAGRMVQTVWDEIPVFYPGVDVDACIIMPNHMHGVIVLFIPDTADDVGAGPRTCPDPHAQSNASQSNASQSNASQSDAPQSDASQSDAPRPEQTTTSHPGQPRGVAPTTAETKRLSLPDVVHRFKTLTTKRYTDGVKQLGWPRYNRRVWQRNYYEHIIRSERILQRVREYIDANPANWDSDNEYPDVFNRKHK